MQDGAIFFLIGGGLVAFLLGFVSMRQARKRRHIRDTPISKAAGVFIGDVEVKGTAESSEPLVSYLAERQCVHYAWSVAEHWRRTRIESYTDSKGNRRTRTVVETGWDTVASGGAQIPFYLLDDSGYLLIRPEGMRVEGVEVFGHECSPSHPLYYGKGPRGSVSGSTERRMFTETAIPIHTPIFVMGAARERTDIVASEIAHSSDARFSLITTASEDSVAQGYTVGIWVAGVFGALAALTGGLLFASARDIRDGGLVLAGVASIAAYLVALSSLWMVMTFNTLLAHRQRVRRGWANIDGELKRRSDLFPNLAAAVGCARPRGRDPAARGASSRAGRDSAERRARRRGDGGGGRAACLRAGGELSRAQGERELPFAAGRARAHRVPHRAGTDLLQRVGDLLQRAHRDGSRQRPRAVRRPQAVRVLRGEGPRARRGGGQLRIVM